MSPGHCFVISQESFDKFCENLRVLNESWQFPYWCWVHADCIAGWLISDYE